MASGFIYAKLPDDTTVFAKSSNLLSITSSRGSSTSSQQQHDVPFFNSIDNIVNGDLHARFIVVSTSSSSSSGGAGGESANRLNPVISVNSYQIEAGEAKRVPITIVVGLVASSSSSATSASAVSEQILKKEAEALNRFAYACVRATSKPSCEAYWKLLLNQTSNNTITTNNNNNNNNRGNLFSTSSRSPCGFPRSIVDMAVPLSFCFVPPSVLGGEDLSFFNRRLSPLASPQDRIAEIRSHMPWSHDNRLTEHITDTLRILSSFVADATISDMKEIMESRFACELLPPHAATSNPKDPKHQQAVESAMINPSEAAQGSFFGRGTWFTGLFCAGDGAVISATNGFFRLKVEDQVFVSNLVADATASLPSNNDISCSSPSATRYAGNLGGGAAQQQQQQQQQLQVKPISNYDLRPVIQATSLPPHLHFVETQVQFVIPTSGSPAPIPGAVAVFTIDENLRFVVGLPKHQQQLAQRTPSEIFMWVSQLLGNSMQTVSAREVAKFCSRQKDPNESGIFGMCLRCFGSGTGGTRNDDDVVVPYHGLRLISYLTPGLLRHYSSILESSIAGVIRQVIFGGKYFGVASSDLVRLNEAASVYEYKTSHNTVVKYYVEMSFKNTGNNGFVSRSVLSGASQNINNTNDVRGSVFSGSSSSLLNSRCWSEMLKISDLIMLDPNSSSTGLLYGFSTASPSSSPSLNSNESDKSSRPPRTTTTTTTTTQASSSSNFSVASFAAPAQQQRIMMMTSKDFSKQTEMTNEAVKHVHWSLQNILYSAAKVATAALPPTRQAS